MTDLDRILSLPVSRASVAREGVLRPVQVQALEAWCGSLATPPDLYWGAPGLAALVGCGHGKTLISLLLPALAGHPTTLHLVPASLQAQLHRDIAAWAPVLPDVQSPRRTVASHESLSARSGRGLLDRIAPSVIIIDEAHAFADPDSARWRRVAAYLDAHPLTRVAILSGSLAWRSVGQCAHLMAAALRHHSPLPLGATLRHWSACLDVGASAAPEDRAALAPLLGWARTVDPTVTTLRGAYQVRLRTCPGVVVTGDADAPTSLRVHAWTPPTPRPTAVLDAVRGLHEAWTLPDGTELVSALETHRHGRTLALGLYQRWVPETVDPDWLERRRRWAGEARALVAYGGAETLADACDRAAAGRVSGSALRAWTAWREVAHLPGPETEDVWLDGGLTVRALAQAAVHGADPTVLWVATPAIGAAAAKALGARYHGAGSTAPAAGRHAVASYRVHGKGWNGQAFARSVALELPSSGATWEQLLARQHRQGQTLDVDFHFIALDPGHWAAVHSGVRDARFVLETTGADQRLLLCDCVGWHRSHPT